jgi:yhgE/pip C-terminal domain
MPEAGFKPLTLARYELKRFRGLMPRVALVFLLLVPLLYGVIYLAANWDPYGRLDQVPVAVVNQDKPATVDGKPVTAGQDFVDSLHRENTFKFIDASPEEAADGLTSGRYYLTITVPETFSADLVSGRGTDPTRAQIMLRRNDANGFVIGTITNSAQNSIARAIDETAVRSYFEAVFANLATIRSGMSQAADGANQLSEGLSTAHDGSSTLSTGITEASKGAARLRDGSGKLAEGASTLADGADALATGAGTLADGVSQAHQGGAELSDGLERLSEGSSTLANGASRVAAGTQRLVDIVDPVLTLAAKRLPKVQAKVNELADAASEVSSGLADGAEKLSTRVSTASSDLETLASDYPELAADPRFTVLRKNVSQLSTDISQLSSRASSVADKVSAVEEALQGAGDLGEKAADAQSKVDELNSGAQKVAEGAKSLDEGITSAHTGAQKLVSGLKRLDTGAGGVRDGATRLKDGASKVKSGTSELSTGATTLADGLTQLDSGATSLDAGLEQLETGAGQLSSRLAEGVSRIPAPTEDEVANAVQVLSAPVDVTMTVDNPAHIYGRGLAPMFFSIALWVMGISAFMLVRPITGRVLAGRANNLRVAISAWLPIGIMSVVAGWLMLGASCLLLGLDPVHPVLTVALVTLVSAAFSAVAHLLRTAFGFPATALLLVVLIIQLASTGGTYPPELLPTAFAWIGHIMPMTYSINAFRYTISGGLSSLFIRDILFLLALWGSCIALLVLVIRRRRRFTMRDLHPALD